MNEGNKAQWEIDEEDYERKEHERLTCEDCEEDRNSAKYLRKLLNETEE